MPNLIETYSRSTGLKIDKPWIKQDFFPIAVSKYITLSAGSGQATKNYDYYQIVINYLNPILVKYGITIIQLGDKDTPLFSGTYDLRAKMTVAQSSHVLKNATAHLGNDSWSAHVAGALGIPLVVLYGTTDKNLHGPHWKNGKEILLESHRNGNKCSFGAEGAKTINLIQPEQVVNSVLEILGLSERVTQNTKFIGSNFLQTLIELVPNVVPDLSFAPTDLPIIVRMDYEHNETGLRAMLETGRKIHLFTKAPIDINLLNSFKANILSYNHEIDVSCPLNYIKIIARIIPSRSFFTRTENLKELADLRFHFFETCLIEQLTHRTKDKYIEESAKYLNKDIDNNQNYGILRFQSNKYLLSQNKIYLSYAHLLADQSTPVVGANEGQVIDSNEFWRESNHQMIYL